MDNPALSGSSGDARGGVRAEIGILEDIVRVHALRTPEKLALDFDGTAITYGELNERSAKVAAAFMRSGVKFNERVAAMLKNGTALYEVLFGARIAGAVFVGVNWRLSPVEVAFILNDSGAKVLVVDAEFAGAIPEVLRNLKHELQVIVVGGDASASSELRTYDSWIEQTPPDIKPWRARSTSDVAVQLYTSGTTGHPKGVMLTEANLFAYYRASNDAHPLPAYGVHLICLPLFHVGGLNWSLQGMVKGGCCVGLRDFDEARLLRLIELRRVTDAIMVPAVLQRLVNASAAAGADLSSIGVIICGGSILTPKLARQALTTFDCEIYGMYGATEVAFGLTLLKINPALLATPELLESAGVPLPRTRLKIVDPDTLIDCEEGVEGEIWIHSPQTALGYWNRPEATQKTFREDGWYRSGDIGRIVAGYVYVTDRLNDMIKTGGENVYSAEVERVLTEHPAVEDAAVIGIPDEVWGESIKAFVVRSPGASVVEPELLDFTRRRLAHYKCPKSVEFVEALPKTASGKTMKDVLRSKYWVGRGHRVN